MSWTTAVEELKTLLSDGDTDKNRWRKRCLGFVNGTNTGFKTFEDRIVTNFVTAADPVPQGVFVDGTRVSVSYHDRTSGQFTLATPPADGSVVEATYYYRWFTDAELTTFLENGMQWLGLGEDFTNCDAGLQPALLKYAASEAYQKLSIKWAEQMATVYKLEDQPNPESKGIQDPYARLAKDFLATAKALRKDFYQRNDQAAAPLFGILRGRVRDEVPKG